jgi:segregation and condensation protein B
MARRKKGAAKETKSDGETTPEPTPDADADAAGSEPAPEPAPDEAAPLEAGSAPQAPLSDGDTARNEVVTIEREAFPVQHGFIDEDTAPTSSEAWAVARAEALAAAAEGEPGATGEGIAEGDTTAIEAIDPGRIESIIESLLFASDRPLTLNDLKRLLGERDARKITAAVEGLTARKASTGVHVVAAAGGWQLRTSVENAHWVGRLLSGRPARLSRAMLETLSIVAYRQPVTRPEIDDIRGVDCGPVLKTLLDRGLIRIIGKKEEVGRPLLYGTTPEFLRTFNLRDLAELPTLREFHELGAAEQAEVDAQHGAPRGGVAEMHGQAAAGVAPEAAAEGAFTPHAPLPADPEENDGLLEELDRAAAAATRAAGAAAGDEAGPPRARPATDDEVTARANADGNPTNGAPPSGPDPSRS